MKRIWLISADNFEKYFICGNQFDPLNLRSIKRLDADDTGLADSR